MENNTLKSNFNHIKKSKGFNSFLASLLAIVLGLLIGLIVMLIANPSMAFKGFSVILTGGINKIGDVGYYATPLIMTGLSVGFAYKMGLFNIGASGQYTMGMFFAMYVGFMIPITGPMHWVIALLAGMLGGMLWGTIPGLFKAYFNVNEVITSIMFNYIGMFLVDMWISGNSVMYISDKARTAYLPGSVILPSLGVSGSSLNIGFIFAIISAILIWVVLEKTTFGYELKATGFNKNASIYAGMNGKKNIILSLVISGGLAGLGGAFYLLAPSTITGSSITYEPINIISQVGFNGIAVALLGVSNPIAIIFSGLFISWLQRGGTLANIYGFRPEIIDLVIAVIIYFSAFAIATKEGFAKLLKRKNKKKITSISDSNKPEKLDKTDNSAKEVK